MISIRDLARLKDLNQRDVAYKAIVCDTSERKVTMMEINAQNSVGNRTPHWVILINCVHVAVLRLTAHSVWEDLDPYCKESIADYATFYYCHSIPCEMIEIYNAIGLIKTTCSLKAITLQPLYCTTPLETFFKDFGG